MNEPQAWWQTFFTGLAVELWLRFPTEEMTRAEADFIQKTLQLSPPAKILDVPCGGGRHSVELAARGFQMTGVDLAPDFLAAARSAAAARQLPVAWEHREMRDLPWPGVFDGAFCFGNSFGYLDDAGNSAFLGAVARCLKPGARFLIDTGMVAEALLATFLERRWYQISDILFLIQNQHDHVQSRLEMDMTFLCGGRVEKRKCWQRIYSYRELCRLLEETGFGECAGYCSLTQEPFRLGAQRGCFWWRPGGPAEQLLFV